MSAIEEEMSAPSFVQLIEAPLSSLILWQQKQLFSEPILSLYCDVLVGFLKGDSDKLCELQIKASQMDLDPEILRVISIRNDIIRKKPLQSHALPKSKSIEWLGELCFVQAIANEFAGFQKESKRLYEQADSYYLKIGAQQKALKARHNALAARSRINPNENLIPEYESLYTQSIKKGYRILAGLARMNLSRDYQLVGSVNLAKIYADEALVLLAEDLGASHHYYALLQQAELDFELGRWEVARMTMEKLLACKHKDVLEAARVLRGKIEGTLPRARIKLLAPTWKERLRELERKNRKKESPDQLEIIEKHLENKSATKEQLFEFLYPDQKTSPLLENRLKNLLFRLRKKRALHRVKGQYFLDSYIENDVCPTK